LWSSRAAFVTLAAALLSASPASAAVHFKPYAVAHTFVTDNQRWVAWDLDSSTTRIVDTHGNDVRDVPTPGECGSRTQFNYWPVGALGSGQLAWSCGVVMSLETWAVRPVPEFFSSPYLPDCSTRGVGRYWILWKCIGYHWHTDRFKNWWTGDELDAQQQTAKEVADLDARGLWRKPCAPLRPRLEPNDDPYDQGAPFAPYVYRRPFGLSEKDRLVLDRCGDHRSVVLSRGGWSDPAFTLLHVTWFERSALMSYDLKTHKRGSVALPSCVGNVPDMARPCEGGEEFKRTTDCVFRLDAFQASPGADGQWAVSVAAVPGRSCPLVQR
jgi:hypothetical protein